MLTGRVYLDTAHRPWVETGPISSFLAHTEVTCPHRCVCGPLLELRFTSQITAGNTHTHTHTHTLTIDHSHQTIIPPTHQLIRTAHIHKSKMSLEVSFIYTEIHTVRLLLGWIIRLVLTIK